MSKQLIWIPPLTGCCVRCGMLPMIETRHANDVDFITIRPSCEHSDGFSVWPKFGPVPNAERDRHA